MTYIKYIRCCDLEVVLKVILRSMQEAEAWMIMRLPILSWAGVEDDEAVVEVFLLRVLCR